MELVEGFWKVSREILLSIKDQIMPEAVAKYNSSFCCTDGEQVNIILDGSNSWVSIFFLDGSHGGIDEYSCYWWWGNTSWCLWEIFWSDYKRYPTAYLQRGLLWPVENTFGLRALAVWKDIHNKRVSNIFLAVSTSSGVKHTNKDSPILYWWCGWVVSFLPNHIVLASVAICGATYYNVSKSRPSMPS